MTCLMTFYMPALYAAREKVRNAPLNLCRLFKNETQDDDAKAHMTIPNNAIVTPC